MAKKDRGGITAKHFTTLSEVSGWQSTICVYGKLITNAEVQPGTSGILHPAGTNDPLQLAQVVGYSDQGRCIRLDEPQIIALPAPGGPADGCGWDPTQYVVWKNLAKNWTTLQMQFHATALHGVLKSAGTGGAGVADGQLRADQIETILRDCIPRAGGNNKPVDLSNILQYYGFDKDGVIAFAGYVTGSEDYGVKRFQFNLPDGALGTLTVSSKLSELANTIQDQAVHQ
jgi:hypothetical protein